MQKTQAVTDDALAYWRRALANGARVSDRAKTRLARMVASGADLFVWLLLAITIAFVMFLKFA